MAKSLEGEAITRPVRVVPFRVLLYLLNGRLLVLGLLLFGHALAISYTVQVAALTDEQAAASLLGALRDQGFPAYLVRLPGEGGQVYRLRVGAFANRAAAARYAQVMAETTGFTPLPALAEDMPPDVIPLEPNLLQSYPWPGVVAEVYGGDPLMLRVQSELGGVIPEARYLLLSPAQPNSIPAWRLGARAAGIDRVFNFPLWPPGYESLTAEARAQEEGARLATVAASLGLGAAALEAYVMRPPQTELPVLVLAEHWNLESGVRERYPALGDPAAWGGQPEGPPLVWLRGRAPPGFPETLEEPLFRATASQADSGEPLSGQGWQAREDGRFTRLTFSQGERSRSWRALVGRPLWAGGDYLLVAAEDELSLYLISRP